MDSTGLPPAFVSTEHLEGVARSFLTKHHPSGEIPIPIEEIVEFGLGLNIIPIPNLYREFSIEGWLSVDRRSISVDQTQLEQFETRFRFTLAHEVSHLILHGDLYSERRLGSLEEWIQHCLSLDPALVDSYEWQARNLAGRILVPEFELIQRARKYLDKIPDELRQNSDPQAILGAVAFPLADDFNVHEVVVQIRLIGDRVGQRLLGKGAQAE